MDQTRRAAREATLDRAAVSRLMSAIGRKGGLKGGKARAARLTAEERRDIARRAAQTRWSSARPDPNEFAAQKRAFQSIDPSVLAACRGRFVVSRNGRIVDSDENLSRLTRRFFGRHPDTAVYIARVGHRPVSIATPFVKG